MGLSKCVCLCTQNSVIKAGNNRFQDLINAPRISHHNTCVNKSILVSVIKYKQYVTITANLSTLIIVMNQSFYAVRTNLMIN